MRKIVKGMTMLSFLLVLTACSESNGNGPLNNYQKVEVKNIQTDQQKQKVATNKEKRRVEQYMEDVVENAKTFEDNYKTLEKMIQIMLKDQQSIPNNKKNIEQLAKEVVNSSTKAQENIDKIEFPKDIKKQTIAELKVYKENYLDYLKSASQLAEELKIIEGNEEKISVYLDGIAILKYENYTKKMDIADHKKEINAIYTGEKVIKTNIKAKALKDKEQRTAYEGLIRLYRRQNSTIDDDIDAYKDFVVKNGEEIKKVSELSKEDLKEFNYKTQDALKRIEGYQKEILNFKINNRLPLADQKKFNDIRATMLESLLNKKAIIESDSKIYTGKRAQVVYDLRMLAKEEVQLYEKMITYHEEMAKKYDSTMDLFERKQLEEIEKKKERLRNW